MDTTTDNTPMAWVARDQDIPQDEAANVIIFHNDCWSARRQAALELGVAPENIDIARSPGLDAYSRSMKVPLKALLREGWQIDCGGCGQSLISPEFDSDSDVDLSSLVEQSGQLFCNEACKYNRDQSVQRQFNKFEAFKEKVTSARPDLTFTQFKGQWPQITLIGKFTFPGAQYGGTVRDQLADGDLEWTVANGDLPAWQAYEEKRAAAHKKQQPD